MMTMLLQTWDLLFRSRMSLELLQPEPIYLLLLGLFFGLSLSYLFHAIKSKLKRKKLPLLSLIATLKKPAFIITQELTVLEKNPEFVSALDLSNTLLPNSAIDYFPSFALESILSGDADTMLNDIHGQTWQLIAQPLDENHTAIQCISCQIPNNNHDASEFLQILNHLCGHIVHDIEVPLTHTKDLIQQLITAHNFQLERSRFLLKELDLEPQKIEQYFTRYKATTALKRLAQQTEAALDTLRAIKPRKPLTSKPTFSILASVKQALTKIEHTKVAAYLAKQGAPVFQFTDLTSETILLQGNQDVFVNSIVALYQVIAVSACDLYQMYSIQTPYGIHIKLCPNIKKEEIKIEFSGGPALDSILWHKSQLTQNQYERMSQVTVNAIIALIQLNGLFQMRPAYGQTLELNFPLNMALQSGFEEQKSAKVKSSMRDPYQQEFLQALSSDLDLISGDTVKATLH